LKRPAEGCRSWPTPLFLEEAHGIEME